LEPDVTLFGAGEHGPADTNDVLVVDFGFAPPLGTIGDYVWLDFVQNGIQEFFEPGVSNVPVSLYHVKDGDTNLVGSMVTSATGYYLFTNLPAGNYFVEFTAPVGFGFTTANQGGNPALDSDVVTVNGAVGVTVLFSLGLGQVDLTRDAGLIPKPTAAVVSWLGAYADQGRAFVTWETVSEQGFLAFEIIRVGSDGVRESVTSEPVWADGRAFGRRYSVEDATAALPGKFSYELIGWRDSGVVETLATVTVQLQADASADTVRMLGLEWTPEGVLVRWSGGRPPYVLERRLGMGGEHSWEPVGPLLPGDTEMRVPLLGPEGYFRVRGGQR
jgi:hypothetical protein